MKSKYLPTDAEYDIYNSYYIRYVSESRVLNAASEKIPSINSIFWDKQNTILYLETIIGDDKGLYRNGSEQHFAHIPFVQECLASLEKQFVNHCNTQVNCGHALPSAYPPDLLNKRLQSEARLDVLNSEVEMIEKRLKSMENEFQEVDNSLLLKGGPKGVGILKDGVLFSLDGMIVKKNSKGILIIDDPRCIFDGYSTSDYYTNIVKTWKLACLKKSKENAEKAKKDGIKLDQLSVGKRLGTNTPWPSMPESCTCFKIKAEKKKV